MNVASKVTAPYHGLSLLDYLADRFTYLNTAAWRELIQQGRIHCNGGVASESTTIARDDLIRCDLPDFEAPAVNFAYRLVYQDEWLLAVNKPAGLRVHSGGKFITANLIYHLRHLHLPAYPEANLVNRLDADTSGLVLLARDTFVLSALARQFAQGLVDKRYLAVVQGRPSPASGSIDLPIGPIKDARVPRYGIDRTPGKAALTRYATVRTLGDHYTLLELRPQSGRTHQLRVHLAAIGHPIAGDALYTMNDDDYLAWRRKPPLQAGLQRQALHSHQLRFLHPVLNTMTALAAPLAEDIEEFIRAVTAGANAEDVTPECCCLPCEEARIVRQSPIK